MVANLHPYLALGSEVSYDLVNSHLKLQAIATNTLKSRHCIGKLMGVLYKFSGLSNVSCAITSNFYYIFQ